MDIYFPMSCQILTRGHIECLEFLTKQGFVIVGLLTSKAMRGYKEEIVPYEDRYFILNNLGNTDFLVVPQDSLDPSKNIKKYGCSAIASGDGWEQSELKAIKRLRLKKIDIKLPGEITKKHSSSDIWKKKNKKKKK